MKIDAKKIFTFCVLFGVVTGVIAEAKVQTKPTPYPTMAPLDQYLMADRDAEAALARSAAPDSISRDAKVLVLGRHGYETVSEGTNGFTCVVERAWMGPFEHPEFWNPKTRGPICFNPEASRSIFPITILRTGFVLNGLTKEQIIAKEKAAFDNKEIPALEGGGMCYMMSKSAYLTDQGSHNMAHLMFYTPLIKDTAWGAQHDESPVMFNPQFNGNPEPINVFMLATSHWSDGSVAPTM